MYTQPELWGKLKQSLVWNKPVDKTVPMLPQTDIKVSQSDRDINQRRLQS